MNGMPFLYKTFFRNSDSAAEVGAPNTSISARLPGERELVGGISTGASEDLDCLGSLSVLVRFKSKGVVVSSGQRGAERIVINSIIEAVEDEV